MFYPVEKVVICYYRASGYAGSLLLENIIMIKYNNIVSVKKNAYKNLI